VTGMIARCATNMSALVETSHPMLAKGESA
jgi:hypothetical protein